MNFRNKYIIGVVCSVLLVSTIIGAFWYNRPFIRTYIPKAELEDYAFILDGRGLVLDWKESKEFLNLDELKETPVDPVSVGKRYVVREEISLNYELDYNYTLSARNTYERGEYFNLVIYDMEKEMSKRVLDVFDLVREFDDNLVPSSYYSLYLSDNTEYVKIITWDKTKLEEIDNVALFIDLADLSVKNVIKYTYPENKVTGTLEEITQAERFQKTIWFQGGRELAIISNDFLEKASYKNLALSSEMVAYLYKNGNISDTNSWSFRHLYPDAYKMFIEENRYLDDYVLYLLPGFNSTKQQVDALELFYPQGKNIFDAITIEAEYSIDGRAHEVNSREEFFRYYKQIAEVLE
ncbi:TPA: hypothetical protein ACGOZ1_001495 [Streptococcus suis]|uniref:hypothetical protein n=1 Tax=Streptococcus suis TaxID=1307 RepID=UPI000CF4BD4D|nr:hypothetical protein [Streptococcus suis]